MNMSSTGRLPLLENEEAWRRLPGAPAELEQLPVWARMLVGPLPLTTARALELDAMHRTGERLDSRYRAIARWAAADANACDYGKALAAADFARSGATGNVALPATDAEHTISVFARKMMAEAYAVTDPEVKQLNDLLGEERLVALVLLLAHASYQDRIFLALGASEEGEVPLPVAARFACPKPATPPPSAPPNLPPVAETAETPEWRQHRDSLAKQKAQPGRIRIPAKEDMLARMSAGNPLAWQAGLAWSRVCYTYQPELTDAWLGSTGAFRQETDLSPVFQNSVFWVITEALRCFY
jgi:hypothetical protein